MCRHTALFRTRSTFWRAHLSSSAHQHLYLLALNTSYGMQETSLWRFLFKTVLCTYILPNEIRKINYAGETQ